MYTLLASRGHGNARSAKIPQFASLADFYKLLQFKALVSAYMALTTLRSQFNRI